VCTINFTSVSHTDNACSEVRDSLRDIDAANPGYDFLAKFDAIQHLRRFPPTAARTLNPAQFRVYVAAFSGIAAHQIDALCHDVEHGAALGLDPNAPPHNLSLRPAHWFQTLRDAAFILDKFISELKKAILIESPSRPLYFINFFAVPKKGPDGKMSKLRLIRNASYHTASTFCINDFILQSAYQIKTMPNLRRYASLMHNRQFMALRDLKDAFRQLLLRDDDHQFQGYSMFGQFFIDRHVAYGVASSAAVCQRFVQLICSIFEQVIIHRQYMNCARIDIAHCIKCIVAYIDDFLMVADDPRTIGEMERRFDMLLRSLGVEQSTSKAVSRAREGVVHGWHWNLLTQIVSMPDEKYLELRQYLLWAITVRVIQLGALQKIIGKIVHYAQISPMAKMFAWHALQSLCYTLRAHGIDFKRLRRHKRRSVFLTLSVVRSFTFWYHLSPYLRSAPIASLAG